MHPKRTPVKLTARPLPPNSFPPKASNELMRNRSLALVLPPILFVSACVFDAASDDAHATPEPRGAMAEAAIGGKSGSALEGHATFTEVQGGVLVEILVENAPPGWHAVHVHETGDCSADDASSAGAHFNPTGANHGSPHAVGAHHAGDLGNMIVGEDGKGHHVILMPDLTVKAGANSVVGRAIIVHAGVDDLATQPTGNAGGRIGCGVIH